MSALTDDLTHARDQLGRARHQLHTVATRPGMRKAIARLDDALSTLETVTEQLHTLQRTALHATATRRTA